jgi:hypothetical protein
MAATARSCNLSTREISILLIDWYSKTPMSHLIGHVAFCKSLCALKIFIHPPQASHEHVYDLYFYKDQVRIRFYYMQVNYIRCYLGIFWNYYYFNTALIVRGTQLGNHVHHFRSTKFSHAVKPHLAWTLHFNFSSRFWSLATYQTKYFLTL